MEFIQLNRTVYPFQDAKLFCFRSFIEFHSAFSHKFINFIIVNINLNSLESSYRFSYDIVWNIIIFVIAAFAQLISIAGVVTVNSVVACKTHKISLRLHYTIYSHWQTNLIPRLFVVETFSCNSKMQSFTIVLSVEYSWKFRFYYAQSIKTNL